MTEVKAGTVEAFVRDIIHLGGVYTVDQEGYVTNRDPDNEYICTVKCGTVDKQLMVLQDVIKDNAACIVNPLNENTAESPDAKWLYMLLSSGLARRVIHVARFLVDALEIENEKDANPNGVHLSSKVVEFASRHKDFDSKTLGFLETISEKKSRFMSVWYDRKLKEAHFRCSVYDPDTALEFPNVTKKAWKSIIGLISDLFGVSADPEEAAEQIKNEFTIGSDLITVPKLESILKVYLKIFQRLNKFTSLCLSDDDDFVVDITTLGHHIENLEAYYKKAKWFNNAVTTIAGPETIRAVGGVGSTIASGIPSNPSISNFASPGYVEPPSGIPSNPARHGIQYAGYEPNRQTITGVLNGGNPGYVGGGVPVMNFGYNSGFNPPPVVSIVNDRFNLGGFNQGIGGYQSRGLFG